jgi:lysophospholipase L1-like esterase
MKILIIGDSIGLPRFHHERAEVEAFYEDTYPEQLRELARHRFPGEDVHVLNRSAHANTTIYLRNGAANELFFFRPDFLILELGMADLWPRKPSENGGQPELPWVPVEEFEDLLVRFLNLAATFPLLHTILVSIPCASVEQYARHSGALERTKSYNRTLQRLALRPQVSLVDAFTLFFELGELAHGSDGIHPSRCASRFLAEQLLERIVVARESAPDSRRAM